jgi:hypothetical protein
MTLCLFPLPSLYLFPFYTSSSYSTLDTTTFLGLDLKGRSQHQAAKWLEQPLHIMYLLLGLDFISSHLGGKTRAFCFGGKSHFCYVLDSGIEG